MRRRFPMVFALGSLASLVLAIFGLSQPADPVPWLTATIGRAAMADDGAVEGDGLDQVD